MVKSKFNKEFEDLYKSGKRTNHYDKMLFLEDDLVLIEDDNYMEDSYIDSIQKFLKPTIGDKHHFEYIGCLRTEK